MSGQEESVPLSAVESPSAAVAADSEPLPPEKVQANEPEKADSAAAKAKSDADKNADSPQQQLDEAAAAVEVTTSAKSSGDSSGKQQHNNESATAAAMTRCSNGNSARGSRKSQFSNASGGGGGNNYEPLRSLAEVETVRDLNSDSVRDILRHSTSDHSLQMVEMGQLEDMSGLNDAFNSSICSLKCRAKYTPKGEKEPVEQDFHFVVKSPPKASIIRFAHKFTRPFCNEVSWYLDLVRQLELANGEGCLKGTLPKCYHANSTYYTMETEGALPNACDKYCCWACFTPCRPSENGVLILENVKKREGGKAFAMFNKNLPVPLPHVKLILHQLARFHGMWLRYRLLSKSGRLARENPDAMVLPFDVFLRRFRTQANVPKIMYKQLKSVAKKTILQVVAKYGPEGEKEGLIQRLNQFFDVKANRTLNTYFVAPPSPECHTLCHGDFWSNNILFTYKEDEASCESTEKTPDDLIIIDYQLINYGHPCYDLVYFLYLNTDLAFRDAHLSQLLDDYYAEFSSYFDVELEPGLKNYTLAKFREDFDWHKQIGFTTACSVMPNVLSDTELNLEGNIFTAQRTLQRKQRAVVEDVDNPTSIEIRRRLIDLVSEMARDNVI